MNMGIITLCFNGGGFLFVYSFWLFPHSYEGNPVESCSNYHLVAVYFSRVMVVGLFTWSWHQSISEVGLRVAITSTYMLYSCWVI
jgi:hypothetical protein